MFANPLLAASRRARRDEFAAQKCKGRFAAGTAVEFNALAATGSGRAGSLHEIDRRCGVGSVKKNAPPGANGACWHPTDARRGITTPRQKTGVASHALRGFNYSIRFSATKTPSADVSICEIRFTKPLTEIKPWLNIAN
jgi:hypothetical protein